ncbi:GNAT family N-acetyltransferase [Gracilibacillus caseinilyticus]|uniref:GNAT family N-acetyltransferase n=1 Tax=Gracilibacillus caseinilyticus TaxID=2932256 RepID=A0ABY4EYF5_9BACI|nr:GNAT family N-acetyltransferase [Gracilibacillus caseinilyticus]UOQ48995.1 GNAT family N-acetyltransferase [Gracilibacillus caseinilyticus]
MIIIETERLDLRELKLEDAHQLSKVLSDPDSMQYYSEPFTPEKVKNWINWNIENYQKYHHGLWAVVLKEIGQCIGDCGITMQKIDGDIVPEIGFHIIKEYGNQGYATEAALACKKYAFDILKFPAVYSYTTTDNIPSQRVAEKIGMQKLKSFEKNGQKQIIQVAVQHP